MLTLERCSVHYGAAIAVDGLSLDLAAGEVLALVGANGAGKTSILKAIIGLVRTSGKIIFDGAEIQALPTHLRVARGIGYSPEGRHVFSDMTVLENLELGYLHRDRAALQARIERMYALFPRLADRRAQRSGSMSGGEQQMLAIGRALMTNPRLVILDEATEGLAPLIREEIWNCLTALKAEGEAILVIDKNVDALVRIADRHVVLEKGRVVWRGSSAELRSDTAVKDRFLHF